MAVALWAKPNVGTNLAFLKGFSRVLKSWKDIVEQVILRKVPKSQPKRVGKDETLVPKWEHHRYSHIQSRPYSTRLSDSLQSRIFRSIVSRTTSKSTAENLLARYGSRARRGYTFRHVPIFGLVGVTLGVDVSALLDDKSENLISDVRGMFEKYNWETDPLEKSPKCLDDLNIETESIANGCEGVVYKAKVKEDTNCETRQDLEFNLAVKALFNYGAESNSQSILTEMQREIVPLNVSVSTTNTENNISQQDIRLPPHPNIVEMPWVFIDDMLVTEEGRQKYPAALPRRLNQDQFFGRNKTLYLVMKRRSSNLREFLGNEGVNMKTRCLLLAQLLEGVSHLWTHGVAHRDLKTDNLLIDLPKHGGSPRLEICDFGCCLAQDSKSLRIPFSSRDLFIGGNCWLMAPEICTAMPGPNAVLDFSKSDLWAAGAIAYEILGEHNPFYPHKDNIHMRLKSASYREKDLPPLPDNVPAPIRKLVLSLLNRDPAKRPSPNVAAAVAQIVILEERNRSKLSKMSQIKITKKKGRYSNRNMLAKINLNTEAQKFRLILQSSLILLSQLTFAKQLESLDMDAVLEFELLSKLTYSDFKMAMNFF